MLCHHRFRSQFLVLALCSAMPVLAQPSELVTDRPYQTESAATIAPGQYQIETGVLTSENDIGRTNATVTEILGTLIRIGLTERVELRAGFDGFVSRKVEGPTGFGIRNEGLGDALIGAKIRLSEPTEDLPQLALLVESSLPTGDSDISSDDWEPSIILAADKPLTNGLQLGANVGLAEEAGDSVFLYSVVAGYEVNSTNGTFIELFGNSEDELSVDTGWTHLLNPKIQLDVAVGTGISDEAPDWFVGVGLSLRFPD